MTVMLLLGASLAYLVGSVPFGLILTGAAGLGDIRRIGSGNIGATNVLRTGNKGLAAATLLLDGLKGFVGVWIAALVVRSDAGAAVGAFAVVVGHCAPPWLGFRGGKGVATGIGALFGLDWRVGLVGVVAWLAAAFATRRSSVGAMCCFVAAAVAAIVADRAAFAWAAVAIAALVVARHAGNIRRLVAGTEPRIGRGA